MQKINYDNKKFTSVSNSSTGEVSSETIFHYHQKGELVWAEYSGGGVEFGTLIAKCDKDGNLDMRYQHLNKKGILMTGVCLSKPEIQSNGKILLYEQWRWTSGDQSSGKSTIKEI